MLINTNTLQHLTEQQFRELNPNVSYPAILDADTLASEGYAVVFPAPQPAYDPITQTVRETDAELTGKGHWEQRWEIVALDAETVAAKLAQSRADKSIAIKIERERRKVGGVKAAGKWFHSDDGSRIQQLGLLMLGANIPAGLQWKTLDGSFVTMTPTLAEQIFAASATSDMAIFAKAEWHLAQLAASETPARYDFSAGWPLTFGEAA